jgi:hypothetical protein
MGTLARLPLPNWIYTAHPFYSIVPGTKNTRDVRCVAPLATDTVDQGRKMTAFEVPGSAADLSEEGSFHVTLESYECLCFRPVDKHLVSSPITHIS